MRRSLPVILLGVAPLCAQAGTPTAVECRSAEFTHIGSGNESGGPGGETLRFYWSLALQRNDDDSYQFWYGSGTDGSYANDVLTFRLSCRFDAGDPLIFHCDDLDSDTRDCVWSQRAPAGRSGYVFFNKRQCNNSTNPIPRREFGRRGAIDVCDVSRANQ